MSDLFGAEAEPHRAGVRSHYTEFALPAEAPFAPLATDSFPATVPMPAEDVVALFATHSSHLVASPQEKADLDAHARAVLADHVAGEEVDLPIRSWAWRTERS